MFDGLDNASKTDNAALGPKLELRRHFLRRYHDGQPPRVFDACQGSGTLWGRLRDEFPVRSYWGVDLKQKRGRLKIDSQRILAQPGWAFDVIDVDTYGSPWGQWKEVLRHLPGPVTVFLTIGWAGGIKPVDTTALEAVGLRDLMVRVKERLHGRLPQALVWKVNEKAIDYCLAMAHTFGRRIIEAGRTESRSAYYYGVRVAP